MKTSQPDPIIAEIRTVRDQHAARFGYDVKAIFRDIQARQEAFLLVANTSAIPLAAQPLSPKLKRPGEIGWPSLSCWGIALAGLVLIMAPTMLVYAFLQQYLTKRIPVGHSRGRKGRDR